MRRAAGFGVLRLVAALLYRHQAKAVTTDTAGEFPIQRTYGIGDEQSPLYLKNLGTGNEFASSITTHRTPKKQCGTFPYTQTKSALGRKTFESIGKPLPGRQTIVVTRNPEFKPEGCLVAHSVEEAIGLARERGEEEVFICGGAEIYARSVGVADRIYLTLVHAETWADTFFPEWNPDDWIEEQSSYHAADEKNEHPFTFKLLLRRGHGEGNQP